MKIRGFSGTEDEPQMKITLLIVNGLLQLCTIASLASVPANGVTTRYCDYRMSNLLQMALTHPQRTRYNLKGTFMYLEQ